MAEIKNLGKAAKRIEKAIKNRERIILYGDTDLDGVCSVLILKEAIQSLGGAVLKLYFPNRERDGYGLTLQGLEELKDLSPAIIIMLDLGISNVAEIALARKNKFEVIIVDHHEVIDKIPNANIVVDPKQPSDSYVFKGLAACGVTFRLAEKLLGKQLSPLLRKSLVELATIGTVADMMPREDENISLLEEGLAELEDPLRPALRVLFGFDEFLQMNHIEMKVTQMISMLNVREVEQGLPASIRFLTGTDQAETREFAERLIAKNKIRKEQVSFTVDVVKERVANSLKAPCIVEGDASFDYLVLGSVASIISNKYEKPAFIYKIKENESLGSVRAPSGYNTVEAMKHCSNLLITYGGHAKASGFRIKNENLEKFKQCLNNYFSNI